VNGLIQGNNAILSLDTNGFVPFLCASEITVTLSSDELPIRTSKDGHWKKVAYQNASWSVSLSGLVKFDDDANFTFWDSVDNWLNFNSIQCRVTFDDTLGNVRSIQGYVIFKSNTASWSAGSLVKTDIDMDGTGQLMVFDGTIPCDSAIAGITVSGQTGGSGIVSIAYTYTGSPYQVKWRLNGSGPYFYALLGVTITPPELANGTYSIEIIPVCSNSYESDNSASQAFIVTHAATCSATVSAISTSGGSLVPTFTGSPSTWKYSIDGGPYTTVSIFITAVDISSLGVGAHTVSVIPTCSNGVDGTGILNQAFTVSAGPTTFTINWQLASFVAGNTIQIFVNGVMNLSTSTPGTGSITGPSGATIIARVIGNNNSGSLVELKTQDTTTSSVLNDQTGHCPVTLSYTFSVTGDTYSVLATVTP
jgi:hypothetical protein